MASILDNLTEKMAKYILLDFDGVITSHRYSLKCYREHAEPNIYGLDWFDPECIAILKGIVDETGAEIIVSSSWRNLWSVQLQRIWEYVPMPGKLAGIVPVWILDKKEAIRYWLKQHPDDRYVIIDDDDLGLDNQYRTDHRMGLVDEDADKIIALLNS